jgi:hypothetical protein
MTDDDQSRPSMPAELMDPAQPAGGRGRPKATKSRLGPQITTITITGIVIAVLLAVGVVVAALDMKFQADQARWQQRQTCIDWYRLQAEYGLGPWYEKLPAAAADCGGGETDDGVPTVPGGTGPALIESDIPSGGNTASTTTSDPAAGP